MILKYSQFLNESNNNEIKDPEFLYHLTPSLNIKNIIENGLCVENSKQHKFDKGVYLTDCFFTASNYSFLDENHDDYYILEIPFNLLNPNKMKPDDYELFDLLEDEFNGYEQLLNDIGIYSKRDVFRNQKNIYNSLTYKNSLYICNQILYTDNILPSKISKIYNKKEISYKLKNPHY